MKLSLFYIAATLVGTVEACGGKKTEVADAGKEDPVDDPTPGTDPKPEEEEKNDFKAGQTATALGVTALANTALKGISNKFLNTAVDREWIKNPTYANGLNHLANVGTALAATAIGAKASGTDALGKLKDPANMSNQDKADAAALVAGAGIGFSTASSQVGSYNDVPEHGEGEHHAPRHLEADNRFFPSLPGGHL